MTASRPETVCFLIPYFYFCVALVLHLLGYATPVLHLYCTCAIQVLHLCQLYMYLYCSCDAPELPPVLLLYCSSTAPVLLLYCSAVLPCTAPVLLLCYSSTALVWPAVTDFRLH